MNVRQPGMGNSRSIEDQHRLRLMMLLDDQERDYSVSRSTADLDVDHRTLTASLENERLTRWMRVAMEDIKVKLSRREMLHRPRRVMSSGMWRR